MDELSDGEHELSEISQRLKRKKEALSQIEGTEVGPPPSQRPVGEVPRRVRPPLMASLTTGDGFWKDGSQPDRFSRARKDARSQSRC